MTLSAKSTKLSGHSGRRESPRRSWAGNGTDLAGPLLGTTAQTRLGWLAVIGTESGVHSLTLGHAARRPAEQWCRRLTSVDGGQVLRHSTWPPWLTSAVDVLVRYAEGEIVELSEVPIHWPDSTSFQRLVLQACRRIPYGRRRSYAELAAEAGSPRAARAVGNVMRTNRLPLLIPCHRVVGSQNHLGGFSAPGGTRLKQRLLDMEAAARPDD